MTITMEQFQKINTGMWVAITGNGINRYSKDNDIWRNPDSSIGDLLSNYRGETEVSSLIYYKYYRRGDKVIPLEEKRYDLPRLAA